MKLAEKQEDLAGSDKVVDKAADKVGNKVVDIAHRSRRSKVEGRRETYGRGDEEIHMDKAEDRHLDEPDSEAAAGTADYFSVPDERDSNT